jgi:hypothetical protein
MIFKKPSQNALTTLRNILADDNMYVDDAEIFASYAIVGNTDDVEGRGAPVIRALSYEVGDARKAATHAGPMGSAAEVRGCETFSVRFVVRGKPYLVIVPLKEIFVSESLEHDPNSLKKQALAKLTPEEKRALGLKDE